MAASEFDPKKGTASPFCRRRKRTALPLCRRRKQTSLLASPKLHPSMSCTEVSGDGVGKFPRGPV